MGGILGPILSSGLLGGGKGKGILQTIGGILGGGGDRPNTIKQVVNDSRKAGIHPLAALGSPVSATYAGPVGSTFTGDAVGDGAAMAGLSRQLLKAQITTEQAKAEALMAEARSRSVIQSNRNAETGGPAPIPLWVKAVDRDGNVMWVPNPDGPDPEQFLVPGLSHGSDVILPDQPAGRSGPAGRSRRARQLTKPKPQSPGTYQTPAGAGRRRRGY